MVVLRSISGVMYAALGLDTERQRRDVEQQDVFHLLFAGKYRALDRGAESDRLVRVDALAGVFPEDLLNGGLHERDARRAADQDDLVDVAGLEAGVLERFLGRECARDRSPTR